MNIDFEKKAIIYNKKELICRINKSIFIGSIIDTYPQYDKIIFWNPM